MNNSSGHEPDEADRVLDLEGFQQVPDDQGLSLERLSQAFARAMGEGRVPYDEPVEGGQAAPASPGSEADPVEPLTESRDVDAACPISPRTIVEALLFVGHPDNQPLTSRQLASLMRGVRPQEVDQIVAQLNAQYRQEQTAYYIASVGNGYRMQLRDEFARLRERFFGRLRRARLSQAAIDVLAIVAYNQPVDRQRIDQLRGHPSGAVVNQLVQRDLIRVEKREEKPRRLVYWTTDRFLDLFGLESLDDLPRHHDADLPE